MNVRGKYVFAIDDRGSPAYTLENLGRLTRLLLDWEIIDGCGGPGTSADGRGAWHVFCHVAAAGAVHRLPDGSAAWTGIIYTPAKGGRYIASTCVASGRDVMSLPLRDPQTRALLDLSSLVAYVEGASRGHILDRTANDPGDPARDDRRQDYDRDASSTDDGGPVWEHWTTSRDIVSANSLGASLVDACLLLHSALDGRFTATIARGRSDAEYGHIRQLCAMIEAGFVTAEEALWEVEPQVIPADIEKELRTPTPATFAAAAHALSQRTREQTFFMYERKHRSFMPACVLRATATSFRER